MKLYKSSIDEIWAYELDGSQDHLIPSDFVQITEEEANKIRKIKYQEWLAAQPNKEELIAALQAQIETLKG